MCTILNKIVVKRYAYFGIVRKLFYFLIGGIVVFVNDNVSAQETQLDITKQQTLGSFPGSPKETLQKYGLSSDIWVTQIYQGIIAGDDVGVSRYGGKTDAFFKIEPEKLGLLRGFSLDAQYEHYLGLDVNRLDDALVAVNTAQAYLRAGGFHSALSIVATQKIDENLSLSIGKFNLLTMAMKTPLIGGGGLNTFMNRAFALPSTGVSYTSGTGGAGDRVILSPPYSLGGMAELKHGPFEFDIYLVDPRSAQSPRVIQRPFEVGVAFGAGMKMTTQIAGLNGTHTLRGAYSNANGVDLNDVTEFNGMNKTISGDTVKNGYYFSSYLITQNLVQKIEDPEKSWGVFALYTISDGNPTPIKWSLLAGLAGNNLMPGRENDRWGVGFYHFGVSQQLLDSLQNIGDPKKSEGGIEAFYNYAINKWCYLSADLQIIAPWTPGKPIETVSALRMQTRF